MREMKDSGVEWIGNIPKEKQVIRNKYIFTYEKGKIPQNTNVDKVGEPYIGASDLDSLDDKYEIYTEDYSIPKAKVDDLLILWDGARAGLSGTNKEGRISSTIVKVSAIGEINKKFLFWYYKGFEKFMFDRVNGTTIPHMNKKYIEEIGLINWNIKEQQQIANYLDSKCAQIDSIIANQKAIIEKLKEYKLSVITEAVTKGLNPDAEMKVSGIDICDVIPEHWNVLQNRYLFSLRDEKNYLSIEEVQLLSLYTDLGVFPHGEQEERGNKAVKTEGYKVVYKDDIVVNIILAWMGAIGRSAYEGVTSPAYDIYKPAKGVCSRFFHYLYRTKAFSAECYKYGRGIMEMRWRTYSSEFKSIKVPVPPVDEQIEIADYLDKKCDYLDKTINDRQNAIEKLQEYKKSLIYEVVTGKREV